MSATFWPVDFTGFTKSRIKKWTWFFCPEELDGYVCTIIHLHDLMPLIQERVPDANITDIIKAIQDNLPYRKMSQEEFQHDITFYCVRHQPEMLAQLSWDVEPVLEGHGNYAWKYGRRWAKESGSTEYLWYYAKLLPKSAYHNIFCHYLDTGSAEALVWLDEHQPKHLNGYSLKALVESTVENVQRFESLITPKFLTRCDFDNSSRQVMQYLADAGFFQKMDPEDVMHKAVFCYTRKFATGAAILWVPDLQKQFQRGFYYSAYTWRKHISRTVQEWLDEIQSIGKICGHLGRDPIRDFHSCLEAIPPKSITLDEKKILVDYICLNYGKTYEDVSIFPLHDSRYCKKYDKYFLEHGMLTSKNIHLVSAKLMAKLVPVYGVPVIEDMLSNDNCQNCRYSIVDVMIQAGVRVPARHLAYAWAELLRPAKEELCRNWFYDHVATTPDAAAIAEVFFARKFMDNYYEDGGYSTWVLGEELLGVNIALKTYQLSNFYTSRCSKPYKAIDGKLIRHLLNKGCQVWNIIGGMLSRTEEETFYEIVDAYDIASHLKPHLPRILAHLRLTESRPEWWFGHYPDLETVRALRYLSWRDHGSLEELQKHQRHVEILGELTLEMKFHYYPAQSSVIVFGGNAVLPKMVNSETWVVCKELAAGIHCFGYWSGYEDDEDNKDNKEKMASCLQKARELIANSKIKSAMKA